MCQLLTPTARPARPYAPVVSDSLRPPGRLGDVSELWLALLETQGEMWWPRLAGTLPGGARPSKAGRVPQHLPAPFGAALGIHFVRIGLKEPRRCPDSANAPPREVEEQPGA